MVEVEDWVVVVLALMSVKVPFPRVSLVGAKGRSVGKEEMMEDRTEETGAVTEEFKVVVALGKI